MFFLIQSARQELKGFPDKQNHRWLKYEETFLDFLMQSTGQDLCGFSLCLNLKKTLLCTTVRHHWGIQVPFDKSIKESQWILH